MDFLKHKVSINFIKNLDDTCDVYIFYRESYIMIKLIWRQQQRTNFHVLVVYTIDYNCNLNKNSIQISLTSHLDVRYHYTIDYILEYAEDQLAS